MDWSKYTPGKVLTGLTENGTRLVLDFIPDYVAKMGSEPNISCPSCFQTDFNKFINKTIMKKKSAFQLNPSYEGVSLGFGKDFEVLSSSNITDEKALDFANRHPKGLGLFVKYPEGTKIGAKKEAAADIKPKSNADDRLKELDALKRTELDELATNLKLNAADYATKGDIAIAIEAAEKVVGTGAIAVEGVTGVLPQVIAKDGGKAIVQATAKDNAPVIDDDFEDLT